MNIQNKLTMDLIHPGPMPRVDVVQGDVNTRTIELTITAGKYLWNIPTGARVSVRYAKSDGTRGIYDTLPDGTAACTYHDNVVEFMLAPQMLTAAGAVLAQIVIAMDGRQLATFSMQINVNSDPSAGAITSEDYVNWMGDTIRYEVTKIFQTAKATGELTGPSPTVDAKRFTDTTGSGVMLTVTNPGTGNQLPSQVAVPILDGTPGITPRFAHVEVQTLEDSAEASAEISGVTNALTLKMGIPRGVPGAVGQSPTVEAERFTNATGSGVMLTITNPGTGNQLPSQIALPVLDGVSGITPRFSHVETQTVDSLSEASAEISGAANALTLKMCIPKGPKGDIGKTPAVSVTIVRSSDGRLGSTATFKDPDTGLPLAQSMTVYDGKTPEKGIDYYTEADKQEMVTAVLAALPAAEGGSY